MGIDDIKVPPGGGGPAVGGPGQPGQVSLTKACPTVSLTKQGSAGGELRVNLNWNARPAAAPGGGFLKRLAALGGGRGYQEATVTVELVTTEQPVTTELQHEHIQVETDTSASDPRDDHRCSRRNTPQCGS